MKLTATAIYSNVLWIRKATLIFAPQLTHTAARSLCDSWDTCFLPIRLCASWMWQRAELIDLKSCAAGLSVSDIMQTFPLQYPGTPTVCTVQYDYTLGLWASLAGGQATCIICLCINSDHAIIYVTPTTLTAVYIGLDSDCSSNTFAAIKTSQCESTVSQKTTRAVSLRDFLQLSATHFYISF